MRLLYEDCKQKKSKITLIHKICVMLIISVSLARFCPDFLVSAVAISYKCIPESVKLHIEGVIRRIAIAAGRPLTVDSNPFESSVLREATQMLLVQVADWDDQDGYLQRYVRSSTNSDWEEVGQSISVTIGQSGVGWAVRKVDSSVIKDGDPLKKWGDRRSPAGVFLLGTAFGTDSSLTAHRRYPFMKIGFQEKCIYDPLSRHFNQLVEQSRLSASEISNSKTLYNWDGIYDLGVIIQTPPNSDGLAAISCHFLRGWDGKRLGTEGETEMAPRDIEEIINWLDREKNPVLVQLVKRDLHLIPKLSPAPPVSSSDSLAQW
jgi:L,D-peptidoglycan transpeptidase YkuD (ErfK/YbiS/YcfS/YnhG family)